MVVRFDVHERDINKRSVYRLIESPSRVYDINAQGLFCNLIMSTYYETPLWDQCGIFIHASMYVCLV